MTVRTCFGKFVICPCEDECVVSGECEIHTTLLIHNSDVIEELERAKSVGLEMVKIDKAISLVKEGVKK
jgi:hypothetical protein